MTSSDASPERARANLRLNHYLHLIFFFYAIEDFPMNVDNRRSSERGGNIAAYGRETKAVEIRGA